jgi:Uncharacterized conserved protein
MKKILITPGITDLNRGDQALIWLIRDLIEEVGIKAEYKLIQTGNKSIDIFNQSKQSIEMGFDVIKPILLHPGRGKEKNSVRYTLLLRFSWGITALMDLFKTILLLSKIGIFTKMGYYFLDNEQKKTYDYFKDIDLLIVKGGGFLHTFNKLTDLYYLYYNLYNIMLAQALGKKVIIMPNSFGPFMGVIEKRFIKKVLSNCNLIYARESISKEYLCQIIEKEVVLSADLGFYIKDYKGFDSQNNDNSSLQKKVAITMRPYRFPESSNGDEKYKSYIYEMYKVIRGLINKGYYPVLVAHTLGPSSHEDDKNAIHEVIELLEKNGILNDKYLYINDPEMNCFDITRLYSSMDYIIGTRFHSVIFAMTSLVPAIAISYTGHKTIGIMKDMGLDDFTINISEISSEETLSKFDNLISDEQIIKDKIIKYMEVCENDKKELINNIIKFLN